MASYAIRLIGVREVLHSTTSKIHQDPEIQLWSRKGGWLVCDPGALSRSIQFLHLDQPGIPIYRRGPLEWGEGLRAIYAKDR